MNFHFLNSVWSVLVILTHPIIYHNSLDYLMNIFAFWIYLLLHLFRFFAVDTWDCSDFPDYVTTGSFCSLQQLVGLKLRHVPQFLQTPFSAVICSSNNPPNTFAAINSHWGTALILLQNLFLLFHFYGWCHIWNSTFCMRYTILIDGYHVWQVLLVLSLHLHWSGCHGGWCDTLWNICTWW